MHFTMSQCAIVILAAGQSSRLGRPKQLLLFRGKSLLRHCAEEALSTHLPVIVIIGANSDLIRAELKGLELTVVENQKWAQGMSSSVRCGVEAALQSREVVEGVLLMVSDQPFVSRDLLNRLRRVQDETHAPIACCRYAGRLGVPALFQKTLFSELMLLQGDAGAKKLIAKYKDQVATVSFPEGAIDVDTQEEYNALLENGKDAR